MINTMTSGLSDPRLGAQAPTLMEIPHFGAVMAEVTDLQLTFDKLRGSYWDNDIEIVFNRAVSMPKDPNRYLSTRAHELILASNASLVNKYSRWCKEYLRSREYLLMTEDQPSHNESAKMTNLSMHGTAMFHDGCD